MKRRSFIIGLTVFTLLSGVAFWLGRPGAVNQGVSVTTWQSNLIDDAALTATAAPSAAPSASPQVVYELTATQSGQSAYDLLRATHDVSVKQYDFGVFVDAINGVASNQQYFWALYHNGVSATVGAADLMLQAGDTVKFVYEEIK